MTVTALFPNVIIN